MTVAAITQIAYAVQNLFDPAGTVGRLVDLGKLANYGLLGTEWSPALLFLAGEQGAWYDPSAYTTDPTGAPPATNYVSSGWFYDTELDFIVNEAVWPKTVKFGDAQTAISTLALVPLNTPLE